MRSIEILGLALVVSLTCCPGGRKEGPLADQKAPEQRTWPDGQHAARDQGREPRHDRQVDSGPQCQHSDQCGALLCIGGSCSNATSCCQIHTLAPQRGDGEYGLLDNYGGLVLTYCDMQLCDKSLPGELCTAVEGGHEGRTRDASNLPFLTRSVLTNDGTCELWALRAKSDGHPLDRLTSSAGLTLSTCQALGFKSDQQLSSCPFGSTSSCGFAGSLYRYGNQCSGCTLNDGLFSRYVLQGPMTAASVISSMDGTTRLICRTR